jgi:hypothetical protein
MPRTSPYPTAEGCQSLVLNINEIMRPAAAARRDARRRAEAEGTPEPALELGARTRWRRRGSAQPWAWAEIAVRVEPGPEPVASATLRYSADHYDRPTGLRVQRVAVASVPCHLGGVRWLWICPATGRHVRHLYLPCGGVQFLSRAAYRLRWASTCATALDRSHRRLARLAAKLGGEYQGFTHQPPDKPPWMRWRTYERLAAQWEAAAGRHDAAWMAGAGRTLRRFGIGTR